MVGVPGINWRESLCWPSGFICFHMTGLSSTAASTHMLLALHGARIGPWQRERERKKRERGQMWEADQPQQDRAAHTASSCFSEHKLSQTSYNHAPFGNISVSGVCALHQPGQRLQPRKLLWWVLGARADGRAGEFVGGETCLSVRESSKGVRELAQCGTPNYIMCSLIIPERFFVELRCGRAESVGKIWVYAQSMFHYCLNNKTSTMFRLWFTPLSQKKVCFLWQRFHWSWYLFVLKIIVERENLFFSFFGVVSFTISRPFQGNESSEVDWKWCWEG